MMKKILCIFYFVLLASHIDAQTNSSAAEGTISYISGQHIYVRFENTKNLAAGDTFFMSQEGKLVAVLKIVSHSSISCVCDPLPPVKLAVGDKLITSKKTKSLNADRKEILKPESNVYVEKKDSTAKKQITPNNPSQAIRGRISIASYSSLSNTGTSNSERLQYSLYLNGQNIHGSKLSLETYATFIQDNKQWSQVKANIFNGLKIYDLSLSYDFTKTSRLIFGRKINPKFSSMGASDGFQFEQKIKSFTLGLIAGTRPDFSNYGFNSNLLQYGGFIFNELKLKNGNMQNTLAFIQQNNSGQTDRRFAYFQHSSSIFTNLNFFGSVECDLYKKSFNPADSTYSQQNSARISNLYLSLRYRALKNLSFSLSYSNRQNIIYYETYKSILDKLLEAATQQGFSAQANYRPVNNMNIGITGSYRFQKNDPHSSRNAYLYLNYFIPELSMNATASANIMDASYLSGNIYSIGCSKDMAKGKLNLGINYRNAKYNYSLSDAKTLQQIAELNLNWVIIQKLSISMYFEGTFEQPSTRYQRLYLQLRQSF
jgi:hypothetical protein